MKACFFDNEDPVCFINSQARDANYFATLIILYIDIVSNYYILLLSYIDIVSNSIGTILLSQLWRNKFNGFILQQIYLHFQTIYFDPSC